MRVGVLLIPATIIAVIVAIGAGVAYNYRTGHARMQGADIIEGAV